MGLTITLITFSGMCVFYRISILQKSSKTEYYGLLNDLKLCVVGEMRNTKYQPTFSEIDSSTQCIGRGGLL